MVCWVGTPSRPASGRSGLTGVPGRPAIEVRAAALFVLRDVRGDVQGPRGDDEVLRIVGLVGSRCDAPEPPSCFGEHQHRPDVATTDYFTTIDYFATNGLNGRLIN